MLAKEQPVIGGTSSDMIVLMFVALDCVFMLPLDSGSDPRSHRLGFRFYIIINDGVLVYSQVSLL
jgi:hypothetical protein